MKPEPLVRSSADQSYQVALRPDPDSNLCVYGSLLLLSLVWLASAFVALDAVPRSFGDEAWYAMPTAELVRSGELRMPALPGRGGLEVAYVQPKLMPNLLAAPLVAGLGATLEAVRLSSVLAGLFALLATYGLASFQFGRRTGLLAVGLMAVNFWFLMAARTFRPEIFELLFLTLFVWAWTVALERGGARAALMAGGAATAAALSHQLVGILTGLFGLVMLVGYRHRPEARRQVVLALLAAVASSLPFLAYLFHAHQMPGVDIWLQWTGEGRSLEYSFQALLAKEAVRWPNFLLLPLGLPAAVVLALAIAAAWRGPSRHERLLSRALLLGVISFALLVPLSTGRYAAVLVPFLSVLAARLVVRCWTWRAAVAGWPPRAPVRLQALAAHRRLGTVSGMLLIVCYLLPMAGADVATARAHRGASYEAMVRQLRLEVGESAVIAGPVAFWLGFQDRTYVVTNVAPTFEDGPEWLEARLNAARPGYLLETTTPLQSTDGLAPRSATFPETRLSAYLARHGTTRAVVPSRDFGPIRIWELSYEAPAGETGASGLSQARVSVRRTAQQEFQTP